jgi:hypothetical protein
MSFLYDAVIETARIISPIHEGIATGGSTTQLLDSLLPYRPNWFDNGTLIVRDGTLDGQFIQITTSTTGAINFSTLAAAPAAGNRYVAIRSQYNRYEIISAINTALLEFGELTYLDSTLTVVADTEEYSLPSGVSHVVRVETTEETASPYGWGRNFNWREGNGKLIFDAGRYPDAVGTKIRVWYNKLHPAVSAYNDTISDKINIMRLAWAAAIYAVMKRNRETTNETQEKEFLATAQGMKAQLAARFPLVRMERDPHLSNY